MPAPTSPSPIKIELRVLDGTLFAIPNAGNVRVVQGTTITWTADFPFTLEFAVLTGTYALTAKPCCPTDSGGTYSLTLPEAVPDRGPPEAPSYKYTVKGVQGGEAAGKVLDPIIIVDKKY